MLMAMQTTNLKPNRVVIKTSNFPIVALSRPCYTTDAFRKVACTPQTKLQCRSSRRLSCRAAASPDALASKYCALIECDGGLVDVHMDGHRVAFNRAFEELGYSCVTWLPMIYNDLLRLGDGTGPGLIKAYYRVCLYLNLIQSLGVHLFIWIVSYVSNASTYQFYYTQMVGWPMMLATKERGAFVENVYQTKRRIFADMVTKGEIPLREGALQFIDDMLADDVQPVILAGTASAPEDSVVSSAILNLGPSRSVSIQVITLGQEGMISGEGESGEGSDEPTGNSLERQIREAQEKAKQLTAASFVTAMNRMNYSAGMVMDASFLAAANRSGLLDPQYLLAIVAALGCSASTSALVGASNSIMRTGQAAGLFVAGVPPSFAARGGYDAADAIFDGYGAGNLTWRKVKAMIDAKKAKQQK